MDTLVVNNNDQHSEPSPRPGPIAGAAHLDWVELIDPDAKTFKPAAEPRALSESKSITPDRELNTYCGGGSVPSGFSS